MSEPLLCGTKDLQAIRRQKLKMVVGILTGHTTLRAHMFKLRLTQRQNCIQCEDERGDGVCIVCYWHWHVKDAETWVMFLTSKDLVHMRVSGLISLVANTRLGIIPQPHFKKARKYNGSIQMYMRVGSIMEPLSLFLLLVLDEAIIVNKIC